jgi:phosphate acetyltransferase
MKFLDKVINKAKEDLKTIVLPEATDIRVLKAASNILENKIANLILLGNEDEIKEAAGDIDISEAVVLEPLQSEKFNDYVNTFYEMRKKKGVTYEQAREIMQNPLYYGVMMVKKDDADGMVAGAANSSADVLRSALQVVKTAPGTKTVSSFGIIVVQDSSQGADGVFVMGDIGLNENPDAEALSEIAVASAESFRCLVQAEPVVALLSYSTYGSASSEMTEKVVEATRLAREKAPDVILDGELQTDAALVPEICEFKAPGSPVAGRANVLIFPDLNTGNISHKLLQRLGKAEVYGPITQGLAKPINDLSRGCSAEDIVGVVAITALQAQYQSGKADRIPAGCVLEKV